jgi:single-strand DNA-binding protein
MNSVTLIGRLCKDPELKTTSNGNSHTLFRLAVQRDYKNEDGERDADFVTLVAWKGMAETVCKYLRKGSKIAIQGCIRTRSYQNNQGSTVFTVEVLLQNFEFLDSKKNVSFEMQLEGGIEEVDQVPF